MRHLKVKEQRTIVERPRCSGCGQEVPKVVQVAYPDQHIRAGLLICWGGPDFMFSLCEDCLKVALRVIADDDECEEKERLQ